MGQGSAVKRLEDVLTNSYNQFIRAWDEAPLGRKQEMMVYALAAQRVVQRLPDLVTEDDARFLLEQKSPLDAVALEWIKAMGLEQTKDQDLLGCVSALRGSGNSHPEQSQGDHTEGITMC